MKLIVDSQRAPLSAKRMLHHPSALGGLSLIIGWEKYSLFVVQIECIRHLPKQSILQHVE